MLTEIVSELAGCHEGRTLSPLRVVGCYVKTRQGRIIYVHTKTADSVNIGHYYDPF